MASRREVQDRLERLVYRQCKKYNARIAVVGTRSSASFLLKILGGTEIPVLGVYEVDAFRHQKFFEGHAVRSLNELSLLKPEDVVVIASSAEATELYDTFQKIRSLCPCRTIHLKTLLGTYSLIEELRDPLIFRFDDFLFGRGLSPLEEESPYWHPVPPGVDFQNKTVLELGPFEGNNTVMLMSLKPKKVISLEARPLNYAKTSVMRSLYKWQNHELVLGDMHLFPHLIKDEIDIIFCSGVFYHSDKPWWLLQTCMQHSETIVLCGHVASGDSPPGRKTRDVTLESGTYHFEEYPEDGDGLSGLTPCSLWFAEKDLIRFLNYYGFHYESYGSTVIEGTGLWIFSVVTKTHSSSKK
ncbi:MAG: class I SAM-dependent methyltransferase [Nitrospinaceae bacterium]